MKRFAGVLASLVAVGCFEPQLRDGQLTCDVEGLCPNGFVCLEGFCRNQAPSDGKGDDPDGVEPDAGTPEVDDPDAAPIAGPRVYELTSGTYTSTPATVFFAGSGLNDGGIVTAWSHCAGQSALRCFGDDNNIACHDGASWAQAPWGEIDGSLAGFDATFSSAYILGGNTIAFDTHRGEDWRGYEGPALNHDNGQLRSSLDLVVVSGQQGVPDLDQLYGGDPNAPSAFDDVVFDYIDASLNGDPWSFVTASGYRYQIFAGGGSSGGQDPNLQITGAPLSTDVRAALHCDGTLMLYALN